ncbi:GmrSD restriction endonuclease domain-containing protein [Streptomyces cinnamoneus]|uniref:GmrSD restriction endonucleases C-terminal domain-containing protein n=1 Tax=Streptomyces cinnamoneus TaxID=53446 RepID=A0A918TWP1_STRCJ|nr:DUF1524 domain-containing protein [Streptomyces cinnamoneus]GHC64470.1 hypothetical protein GCM10010507_47290 [Streptomyces cinnamoneus]
MRPEEIFMPWYRRLTLPSVITMGLVFSGTALPGTAADAAPRTGQAPAYQRGGASPMDYEEASCEGPSADEGDVYSQPPRTSTTKPPEGTHPKGPEGTHPKPSEGTHAKTQEGTHTKPQEGTHPKAPEGAPSTAPKDAPAKAQEGTHPKTTEGTHAKAPEAAPSTAPKDAPAKTAEGAHPKTAEGTHSKTPEGTHAKPQEGTHPKAPEGAPSTAPKDAPAKTAEGTHPKTAEGTHPKAPEAAPSTAPKDMPAKAQEGQHPKTAEGTHAKAPEGMPPKAPDGEHARTAEGTQPKTAEGTHPKAPEAAPSAAPKDAPAKEAPATHRALPMNWPRNIPDRDDAARMLDELDVQPFSSKGYDRRHFGGACWVRHGINRCTTRELVLKLQSVVPATLDGLCRVVGGKWRSEYDNRDMADPTHIDVDHIVPLRNAWGSGASSWTPRKRQEFANDMTATPQLIAVSTWSNRRKGDKGPDKWLPQGGECTYSRAWIAVKDYYGLSVTLAEKAKLEQVLAGCRN